MERTDATEFIICESCRLYHHVSYIHPQPGYDFKCMRCGHEWRTHKPSTHTTPMPKMCSRCKSSYWDRPKLVRKLKLEGGGKVGGRGGARKRKQNRARKNVELRDEIKNKVVGAAIAKVLGNSIGKMVSGNERETFFDEKLHPDAEKLLNEINEITSAGDELGIDGEVILEPPPSARKR